jgi:hypothetical protein
VSLRYLTCAQTAKMLRADLKTEFPGVKFSVRSHVYSGGASIEVNWTDGPAKNDVQRVADRWSGASFDGMTDSMTYRSTTVVDANGNVEEVRLLADFVFATRLQSAGAMA